ncbi:DUF5106 domain-containing protein [Sphingobacterium sp. lm-10]|uniref:DUF5106 domain-containing protein n=1 Tax=Sphingobacterium sp. lm-10 TaxID=2944904 RepID=UPI00202249CB|nr:DUF5106 domain-containing protein [Sphingobacterium sp. lm-10]MCL7988401.1 DUF5106 domain-containing protein [Sphingobacterium sp. lm-10]
MRRHFIFYLALLLILSCTERKQKTSTSASAVTVFWDKYDFTDSIAIVQPEVGEQALVDFLAIAQQSDYKESVAAIKKMLERAVSSPTVLKFFIDSYDRYLYDPNSPMYNEALYVPVLEFAAQEANFPNYERQRFQDRLNLIKRNNPGNKATNFSFKTVAGNETNLYSQEGQYLLLFFYEPGCAGCAAAIEDLQRLKEVQEWISQGNLHIITLYAGVDPVLWKEYQQFIPSTWVNGINADRSILEHNLYDLKATPTFYLLDEQKEVLLKDRPLAEVVNYLDRSIEH